ncbi:RNase P subunit p30-domain-containing protein [Thelephora terrestris]|uniref:RNase P subunit p30-domain-containing protein n=1 Tax=Thelephora terrestris TaxID=56493 RepID=A0A9P6HJ14_9AGAM|nr:RNase P subunit p30-domain-containing protein [Thelephora terrestris]
MFFDLNIPIPTLQPLGPSATAPQSKKGKAVAKQTNAQQSQLFFSPVQIAAIENRVELLVHLGYSVFAFNQAVHKKLDPKTHQNLAQTLLSQLKRRPGVAFLKRITIILDEDSEKGFGLASASASIFSGYDIIALTPTTPGTLSLACLTHSQPSALTAHVISLPLTLPRLPFHLKHTLIRTAKKNGAVFEMNYSGAFGSDPDAFETASAATKRNWWAAAREVIRVTKGKGLIVSGGVTGEADLRAPRDIINLITMLDLAQDLAHGTMSKEPQALVLRARESTHMCLIA